MLPLKQDFVNTALYVCKVGLSAARIETDLYTKGTLKNAEIHMKIGGRMQWRGYIHYKIRAVYRVLGGKNQWKCPFKICTGCGPAHSLVD